MIPFIISGHTVTAFVGGDLKTMDSSHPNFETVCEALTKGADVAQLLPLLDIRRALQERLLYEDESIQIGYDTLIYRGRPIHNYLARSIIKMVQKEMDVGPWLQFLKRLERNPDDEIRDHLFEWLEKADMPITPDGCFLAYKKVRDDYLSFHDGETRNHVGTSLFLPREVCDPDHFRYCSSGLHFCSYNYLPAYHGSSGRVVVLKIDPADVVAFPKDHAAKGRAYRYTVVDELPREKARFAFPDPVYATDYDDIPGDPEDGARVGIFRRLRSWTKKFGL